ncbi:MAG: hypothetical protein HF978_05335 [Desulfobacteraceae bacterium]|nr:hypothetical protein [Desulfobacteraceae bacterium]MBC2754955.1 hypothetical protein [Desulfobacteraceae bacterium]
MSDKEQIIDFFLDLFKLQCKNPNPGANALEYALLPSDSGPDEIYELRVRSGVEWETRRMSICQVGDTVESKSTCYKIIYDDQLVIKIPPKPFTDFEEYLEYINNERHIVNQLTPSINCLSPSLSAILNMVPDLSFSSEPDPGLREDKYIQLLTSHPRLQKHLKIGKGFVFFMSLSRSTFFNQVIEKIHDKTRAQKEMLKNTSIFEDIYAFEALYGSQYDDVFFKINNLYHEYGKIIDILLPQHENYGTVPVYKKQEWFYFKLAGEKLEIDENELSDIFTEDLNQLLDILMEEKEAAVIQYRGISEKYISKKIFDNNRKNIEGLIVNTLILLYHLRNQQIAIRDLKPDNIFIAGNFDGADNFLNNPEAFSLGLIDLETAGHLHPDDPAGMRQPLLAGTFPFMTPHHLFKNKDLYKLFGKEICRVLYMQDWYAAIGIIFNVVTGKTMFLKTAKLMHKIFEIKKKAVKEKKSLTDTLKSVSWIFWNTASIECYRKIKIHSDKFRDLDIKLPEPIIGMLKDELQNEKAVIKKAIKVRINSKPYLKKDGQKLYHASSDQVAKYRKRWENGTYEPQSPADVRNKIVNILKGMESLKIQTERHDRLIRKLDHKMPCDELLIFLFNRVLNAMYRQFWTYREYPIKDEN